MYAGFLKYNEEKKAVGVSRGCRSTSPQKQKEAKGRGFKKNSNALIGRECASAKRPEEWKTNQRESCENAPASLPIVEFGTVRTLATRFVDLNNQHKRGRRSDTFECELTE